MQVTCIMPSDNFIQTASVVHTLSNEAKAKRSPKASHISLPNRNSQEPAQRLLHEYCVNIFYLFAVKFYILRVSFTTSRCMCVCVCFIFANNFSALYLINISNFHHSILLRASFTPFSARRTPPTTTTVQSNARQSRVYSHKIRIKNHLQILTQQT